jgi:tetratricopeptide (TPR) repeat protein
MKKPIKILLFLLITALPVLQISAQVKVSPLRIQKLYADSLFNAGNYYQAITEYKRLIFFDKACELKTYSLEQIAVAYKKGGFYKNAADYFSEALINTEDIVEKGKIEISLVRTFLCERKIDKALNELDEYETFSGDSLIADYWRGWTYMLNNQTRLASYYFKRSKAGNEIAERLDSIAQKEYSVFNVKLMSYILPGSGQIYTGHYLSGAMSFAWNALFGYMTIKAFHDRRIVEGLLIGDLLWYRFYRGNIQNAEKFANEKNIKLINQLIENLQNNYKGKMP